MERLRYYLKEGFHNVFTNGFMSVASIGVLTICLLMFGVSFLFSRNVEQLITQIEDKNQIMVYLKDSVDQKGIAELQRQLSTMRNVKSVAFVSKQEALASAKKDLGSQSPVLSGYDKDNPYPNAFKVGVGSMSKYASTAKQLAKISGVEYVKDNSDIASKLNRINWIINMAGWGLFIVLVAVALFLISNSIKIAVYVRRREINIMKFVGATDSFIRWPFVVEGIILGVMSGILSIAALWGVYAWLLSPLFLQLSMKPLDIHQIFGLLCLCCILAGSAIGVSGSMISLRKYLNV